MNLESKREEMIAAILRRPAMYFGDAQDYLSCFDAFLYGYGLGFVDGSGLSPETGRVLPEALQEFIVSRLGEDRARPGWIYRVVDSTESPDEAWELFKQLYTDFKQQSQQADKSNGG